MTDIPTYRMLINGVWVGTYDGYTFESVNREIGKPWVLIAEAIASDTNKPVLQQTVLNDNTPRQTWEAQLMASLNAIISLTDHN